MSHAHLTVLWGHSVVVLNTAASGVDSFSSPAEGNLSSLIDHTIESGRQEFSRAGQQGPLGHPFSGYSVKLSFLLEVANWKQILWFLILFYCGKNILHVPYPLNDLPVRDATLLTAGTM